MILWNKLFPMRFYRDLCEGIGLYGTLEAFGQGHFPQTLSENNFMGISPFPKKNPWAPPGPLVGPLLARFGAIAYLAIRSPAQGPWDHGDHVGDVDRCSYGLLLHSRQPVTPNE